MSVSFVSVSPPARSRMSVRPPRVPCMVAALSPSRASDFMQCPLLYRFRVIDKLPQVPSAAAARGTLVHAVLERLVDRLDLTATGEMRVVDYKTGKAPSELFEGKALFQMKFYALVLWRLRGEVPRLLQLVYLGGDDPAIVRYSPDVSD